MVFDQNCVVVVNENGSLKSYNEIERDVFKLALKAESSLSKVAEELKISRQTLYRKIKEYGLEECLEKVRKERKLQKLDREQKEREAISKALEETADWIELCSILNLEKKTLQQKMNYYGLQRLNKAQREMRHFLRAQRERFEAAGKLSIAA